MQQYGRGGQRGGSTGFALPICAGPNGCQFPFNPDDPFYHSKFGVGFQGCFKCDKTDHNTRARCPFGSNSSREMLEIFYRELKINKPAFRILSNEFDEVSTRYDHTAISMIYDYWTHFGLDEFTYGLHEDPILIESLPPLLANGCVIQ